VCSPTRSTVLTGRHVTHTGICAPHTPQPRLCLTLPVGEPGDGVGADDPDCSPGTTLAVPTQFTMLPAHLKKLGYTTAAIGKCERAPRPKPRAPYPQPPKPTSLFFAPPHLKCPL